MNLEVIIIVAVVVAAVGALSTQAFRQADSPHLLTVRGTRSHLALIGGVIWFSAIAIGLLGLVMISLVMPSIVAVAIFFGIEAVALDICAYRINYEQVDPSTPRHARVPIHHR